MTGGGVYDMRCAACCARLIVSAWPLASPVEAMIEAVRRSRISPPLEEVLAIARSMLDSR